MTKLDGKKKKVLMVGPDRSVHGGISAVVNGLYEAGIERYADIKYIGTMREGSKFKKLAVAAGAYIRFLTALGRADIVHIQVASDMSFERKRLFILAAHKRGKKLIIHQHGGDLKNWVSAGGDKRKKRVAETLNMADRLIVLTPVLYDTIRDICSDSPEVVSRMIVMPNSVKIPEVADACGERPAGDATRSCEAPVRVPHSILFLGRICEDKGIRELIDAMDALKISCPDVHLTLGGIWEEPGLKALAEARSDYISFAGWLTGKDKDEALRRSEIFVLPSYYEGHPVSVIEAMASGCLVVATDVGGIPMMVEDGHTGLLVKPRDVQGLTDALLKALSPEFDPVRAEIVAQARSLVEKDYDINGYIRRLIGIYEEM